MQIIIDMFDIRNQYNKLDEPLKALFRMKLVQELGITEYVFYNWYTRNSIPEKYHEQYKNFISNPIKIEFSIV